MKKTIQAILSAVVMFGLLAASYTVVLAAYTTLYEYTYYGGNTYTKYHNYEKGSSTWNAYVQSRTPGTVAYSYVGGTTWAQRRICAGAIVASQNNGGWANYNSGLANSSVFSYAFSSGGCSNERMGIYSFHQWQDYGWSDPISDDYETSLSQ